jgi:hypothetical protein
LDAITGATALSLNPIEKSTNFKKVFDEQEIRAEIILSLPLEVLQDKEKTEEIISRELKKRIEKISKLIKQDSP